MRGVRIEKFTQEDDDIQWLIDGLLPNVGWTLFYGERGFGKTTFAMQLCAALQEGTPFLERKTLKRTILFIQADSLPMEWRMMLKRIAPKSQGFTVVDVPSQCLGNPDYVERLQHYVETFKPGFVVFDSLYNLTAWPINTESVLLPINLMKQIVGAIPWLLIHHPPHHETRAAGHHSLGGNCSNEWALLKTKMNIEKGRLVKDKEILLGRDGNGLWIPRKRESSVEQHLTTLAQLAL